MLKMYKPRKKQPLVTNKYYRSMTKGGLNKCLIMNKENGYVLPNCVGYAYGAFMEGVGMTKCNLSTNNAERWYSFKDGYKRGTLPKVGAVLCQSKGDPADGSDGAGHVSIVIEVEPYKSITVAESHYKGGYFNLRSYKWKSYNWGKCIYQGFILPPNAYDYNLPYEPIQRGSIGYQVIYLQKFLAWADLYDGKIDGKYLSKTEASVKKLQKQLGLYEDGYCGAKTIKAIWNCYKV